MTTATAAARRMSLWRLEWLRLVRTPRAVSLGAVYLAMGLIEPVVTKYASALLSHVARGTVVSLPKPTPAQALSSYVSEATIVGLIVLVAVAASAYNFDARPGLSAFFRTRVPGMWRLVAPRFAASAAAGVAAYLLGTLAAWYETRLLIGALPAGGLLAGTLCAAVYLSFAVAVTALAAALTKTTVASVGITLAILLAALPLLGDVHAISSWVPAVLVGAPADLVTSPPPDNLAHFVPALGVSAVAAALALAAAVRLLQAREA
jgi:ABC-2 type transport system permease protein